MSASQVQDTPAVDAPLPPYTEPPGVSGCGPGQCTCGATIDAQGVVHPALVTS